MRPKHLGKRKRQRPSYLHDFLNEDEDGDIDLQKTPVMLMKPKICKDKIENEVINVIGEEDKCCLCDGQLLNNRVNLGSATGSSDLSYSHVLNKILFQSSEHNILQNMPKFQFTSGYLCIFCKVPISDLDLLQHKIIGLMKVVLLRAEGKLRSLTQENKIKSETQGLLTKDGFKSKKPVHEENLLKTKYQNMKKKNKNRRKPNLKANDAETKSDSEPDTGSRPKRDKPSGAMSDIERAKIKNLPADLKFQVKKRSKKDPFIIEFLKEKKGNTYLVKWENRHENENSWEPRSKIPSDVLEYYEGDLRRLGTQVPVLSSPRELEVMEKSRVKFAEVKDSKNSRNEKEIQIENSQKQKEGQDKDEIIQEIEKEMEEAEPISGEYIEQPFEEIFDTIDAPHNMSDSLIIKEEAEEPRKSKREPKPKLLGKEFIVETEKSTQEKHVKQEIDDSTLVRKSSREPKPKKFMDQSDFKKTKKDKNDKSHPPKKKTISDTKTKVKTYIIESLVERKGEKYLVKWEGYPPEQNTWEPRSNIPKFITQFYEQDPARLGMPAPDVS